MQVVAGLGAFRIGDPKISVMNATSYLKFIAVFGIYSMPWLSRGSLVINDSAANYTSWGSSLNNATTAAASGSGVAGWTFHNTASGNGSQNGSFLGGSAQSGQSQNINTGGKAFGLYANSGQTADAVASFGSGNVLQSGQHLLVNLQYNSIQSGGTVGLSLQNSSGQNVVELYFVGGNSFFVVNPWSSSSSSAPFTTSFGYTSAPLAVDFSIGSGSSWSMALNGTTVDTGSSLWDSINQIRFFDFNGGSGGGNNFYFNSLQVVPEPMSVALPLFGGVFGFFLAVRQIKAHKKSVVRMCR